MNKYMRIAMICGALVACMLLSACGQFGGGRDQIDNILDKIYGTSAPETAAPEGTTSATTTPEPVVRYDYLANDMSAFVSLSKEQYQAFEINVGKDYLVTDEVIEQQLKSMMYQYATPVNGTEQVKDQPIRYGDKAYIYYRGEVDGVAFDGGSNMSDQTPYGLGIGSGSFIPGFEEGLIGVVPSETSKDTPYPVHVTFPENYQEDLAGKDAIFYVVVEYVVQYEIPELTDKFVEETLKYKHEGVLPDVEGALVDAYKASIKKSMEESALAAAEQEAYAQAMQQLMDQLTFTAYPEGEVESYYNSYIKEFESYYAYYKTLYGYSSLDEFAVDYMGLEKGADWKAELTKSCQETVKQSILIHAIAEAEGMEQISDEEFKAELDYLVEYYKQYNYTAEYIREQMGDDAIKESALFGKIEKLIMERITIKYE